MAGSTFNFITAQWIKVTGTPSDPQDLVPKGYLETITAPLATASHAAATVLNTNKSVTLGLTGQQITADVNLLTTGFVTGQAQLGKTGSGQIYVITGSSATTVAAGNHGHDAVSEGASGFMTPQMLASLNGAGSAGLMKWDFFNDDLTAIGEGGKFKTSFETVIEDTVLMSFSYYVKQGSSVGSFLQSLPPGTILTMVDSAERVSVFRTTTYGEQNGTGGTNCVRFSVEAVDATPDAEWGGEYKVTVATPVSKSLDNGIGDVLAWDTDSWIAGGGFGADRLFPVDTEEYWDATGLHVGALNLLNGASIEQAMGGISFGPWFSSDGSLVSSDGDGALTAVKFYGDGSDLTGMASKEITDSVQALLNANSTNLLKLTGVGGGFGEAIPGTDFLAPDSDGGMLTGIFPHPLSAVSNVFTTSATAIMWLDSSHQLQFSGWNGGTPAEFGTDSAGTTYQVRHGDFNVDGDIGANNITVGDVYGNNLHGSLAASNLTGALPEIDGANLTVITADSLVGTFPSLDAGALYGLTGANIIGTLNSSLEAADQSFNDDSGRIANTHYVDSSLAYYTDQTLNHGDAVTFLQVTAMAVYGGDGWALDLDNRILMGTADEKVMDWQPATSNVMNAGYWFDSANGSRITGDGSGLTDIPSPFDQPLNTGDTPTFYGMYLDGIYGIWFLENSSTIYPSGSDLHVTTSGDTVWDSSGVIITHDGEVNAATFVGDGSGITGVSAAHATTATSSDNSAIAYALTNMGLDATFSVSPNLQPDVDARFASEDGSTYFDNSGFVGDGGGLTNVADKAITDAVNIALSSAPGGMLATDGSGAMFIATSGFDYLLPNGDGTQLNFVTLPSSDPANSGQLYQVDGVVMVSI